MLATETLVGLLFFLAIAVAVALRFSRNRPSTLVLQKFTLAASPLPAAYTTVEIVGRMQGVVAFVLSLIGFSPITRITIAGGALRCQSSSLFGQHTHFIPLRCISSCAAGVHKPISAIVWAVVILIAAVYVSFESGSWAPIAIGLVIAVALMAVYVLTKKFFIEVHPHGGPAIGLLFKPNVIEGVPIDVGKALAVVALIRDMIVHQGETASASVVSSGSDHQAREGQPPRWAAPAEPEENTEEIAERRLAEARELVQGNRRQEAISLLQEIVQRYPETNAAQQARRSLQRVGIEA